MRTTLNCEPDDNGDSLLLTDRFWNLSAAKQIDRNWLVQALCGKIWIKVLCLPFIANNWASNQYMVGCNGSWKWFGEKIRGDCNIQGDLYAYVVHIKPWGLEMDQERGWNHGTLPCFLVLYDQISVAFSLDDKQSTLNCNTLISDPWTPCNFEWG